MEDEKQRWRIDKELGERRINDKEKGRRGMVKH